MGRIAVVSAVVMATALSITCGGRGDAPAVNANGGAVGTTGLAGDLAGGDTAFVRHLTTTAMSDIEFGRVALERSANAQVRKFAQLMIDDRAQRLEQLSTIAMQYGMDVPSRLDEPHRRQRDRLARLWGGEFDREYMRAVVGAHKDVLATLESRIDEEHLAGSRARTADQIAVVSRTGGNAPTTRVDQWAADSVPTIRAQLEAAGAIDDVVAKRLRTSH